MRDVRGFYQALGVEARVALAEADFSVIENYNHGLPHEPAIAFVTCEGESPDAAAEAVRALGFRLRQRNALVPAGGY